MKIYKELARELASGGANYSKGLSEVDLTDPDDVKVLANDPEGEVLVHLGSSDYLDRFKIYVAHLREWQQQFQKRESVDLRYDLQIIVNPDLNGVPRQPTLSAAAVRAAMSAGVKPAALVVREPVKAAGPPKAIMRPTVKATSKPTAKSHWRKKWTPAKRTTVKPAPHVTVSSGTSKPSTKPQKPSTAIAKGQGTP